MPFIKVENLVHKFFERNNEGEIIDEKNALDGVDFQIEAGQFIAILGRNGSGKSTLARHLNCLLFPHEGSIWIDGNEVKEEDDINIWNNRKNIGMVFQNPDNQIIGTTVEEDTAFGPENLEFPTEKIRDRVDNALKMTGMYKKMNVSPNSLSGGQKQRVAIAGTLAMHPKCIVLDEATAMLDPDGRKELISTVHRLNKEEGITIILITHFMNEAVDADRIFVMDNGRVTMMGTPKEVFSRSDEIKNLGLEMPVMMNVAIRLKNDGYEMPVDVFTIEKLADVYEQLYRKHLNGE
ncbi:MAG: energy-coupling factor transporter ATPase [Lachnospiraceae bacterium]|nr:energy-coupling factor transporter ATPase [Lachnospiraceae bacterium]